MREGDLYSDPAELAFQHVTGLTCYSAHITGKNRVNLASYRRGQFALDEINGRLSSFLRVFLTYAGFLHDDINELLHSHKYAFCRAKQPLFPVGRRRCSMSLAAETREAPSE